MNDAERLILMFDPGTGDLVHHCSGPCDCGGCPDVAPGDAALVSCAGMRLLLARGSAARTGTAFVVPQGASGACPLARTFGVVWSPEATAGVGFETGRASRETVVWAGRQ